MMRVWAVANQKGGVGKTTTTLALASLLAERGRRVLAIDLDPHASLTRSMGLPCEPPPAGTSALFDDAPPALTELARPSPRPRLDFVAAQAALATLEKRSATRPGLGLALDRALAATPDGIDYVLLDCPPTLGLLMVNALAAADRLIVPTQTEPLALHGLAGMLRTATMIERSRRRAMPVAIVPTLYDRRTRIGGEMLEQLRQRYGSALFDGAVPVDTRMREPEHVLAGVPTGRAMTAYAQALDWLLDSDATARPELESAA